MTENRETKPLGMVERIMAYEQGDMDQNEMVALFQDLIDNGLCWQLQGHYGRTAAALIEAGHCHAKASVGAWSLQQGNRDSCKLDKEELLEKLGMLRGVLTGELDPKALGYNAQGSEGGNRRNLALLMVDAIGTEVQQAIESERKALEGEVFGFARWTHERQVAEAEKR